jgi:hypothetical protein
MPRQAIGQCRLANAHASRKQPSMMHPPTGKCVSQYFFRRLVSKQGAGFPGMRKSFEAVGLR